MRTLARVLPLLLLLACNPPTGNINVSGTATSPWSSGQSYVLAAGAAGALSAAPTDSSGKPVTLTVYAAVDDPTIAQVYTTTSPYTFVVVGESLGSTNLRFSGGTDPPQVVPVNVVGQTAP